MVTKKNFSLELKVIGNKLTVSSYVQAIFRGYIQYILAILFFKPERELI